MNPYSTDRFFKMFFRHPKTVWRRRMLHFILFFSVVFPVLFLALLRHFGVRSTVLGMPLVDGLVVGVSCVLAGFIIIVLRVLQRGEEKYRVLVSNNPYVLWTSNRQGKPTFISPNLKDICGIYPEEIYDSYPRFWLDMVHLDDVPHVEKAYRTLIETGQSIELEYRFEKPDGTWIWLQEKGVLAPVSMTDMYVERVLSDITRRKHSEQSTAELVAIVDSSDDAIIGVTLEGIIYSWNRGAQRIFGYSNEEVRDKSLWMFFPFEKRDEMSQILDQVENGEHVYQYDTQWVRKDGQLVDVSLTISLIKDPSGLVTGISTLARDISAQRRNENSVAESKKELREYIDHMSTMSAKLAPDGEILLINRVAEIASGLSLDELFRTNFLEGPWFSFDPMVQQRVRENFKKAVAGESINYEEKILFAGVQTVTINFSLTPVSDDKGKVSYVLAEARDISALKKTQEALIKAQQIAKLGSWEWNISCRNISWSESTPRLLGLDLHESEMEYETFLSHLPTDMRKVVEDTLQKCLDTGGPFSFDHRIELKSGQSRWIHVQGELFFDDLNKPVWMEGTVQEITERKKMEDQRLQLAQEKENRDNAEQAHQRAGFLAEASLLLSSSLDYEETLKRLARLLTVSLADWCVIYLTHDKKNIFRTVVAHTDPGMEEMANKFFQKWTENGYRHHPIMRVLTSGKSKIITDTSNTGLNDPDYDSTYIELARILGFKSVMMVPLTVRGQTLGVIEFVVGDSNRVYDANDLMMAEELSHYAGVAIENARLYTEALAAKETMKRGEEAARALAAIVESSDDAIIRKTLDGVVTHWNMGAEKLYGYKEAEIVGQSISTIIPRNRPNELSGILARIKSGQKIEHFETVRQKKDGTLFNVSLTISVIKDSDGTPIGASTIARDVTERKRYEEGLAAARDAAIISDRMKSEFVANVSHEIRTPMNGIIGMTSLLLDTKLSPKQKDFAETVRSSCDSLLTIVNDILDFSKIEAGKMSLEIQDFDLAQLFESTGEFLAPRAHFKGLELISIIAHDVPKMLRGDPARLRQVLTNFIGNAIKFTDKGEIIVRATKDSETNSHVTLQLSVSDTGIGIPTERQGELFQPFNQADASATRRYGGTGLGLAISKRFIELMGGEIGVKSEAAKGSTFWCLITLEKQKSPIEAASQVEEKLAPIRILVVDENPIHREGVLHQLNSWKTCTTECAADSADALEILKQDAARGTPYQVVLINQKNSDEDILSLPKKIKANRSFNVSKVIMMTMVNQPIDTELMREVGVAGCLTKPIKSSALYECLLPTMRRIDSQQQISRKTDGKPARQRRRILVVEDNGVNQKVMLQQLENLGYSADAVGNGLEAIQALEHVPYDLILMDCQMPEMDGYAATAMIRKREQKGTHVPIIAMTAHVMTGDREKCLNAGMDDYIAKPIKTENLRATLSRWDGPQSVQKEAETETPAQPKASSNPLSDPKFVRQISRLFVQETPKYLHEMRDALKKKDFQALYVAAHTLAGSCCIVGTQEIKEVCRRVEAKAEAKKTGGLSKILDELDQEFEVAQKILDVGARRNHHESTHSG